MALSDVLQQIANGLILGSFYALVALGYSMVYGIIKLLNFAHGDVYMTGAFVGFLALALDPPANTYSPVRVYLVDGRVVRIEVDR